VRRSAGVLDEPLEPGGRVQNQIVHRPFWSYLKTVRDVARCVESSSGFCLDRLFADAHFELAVNKIKELVFPVMNVPRHHTACWVHHLDQGE